MFTQIFSKKIVVALVFVTVGIMTSSDYSFAQNNGCTDTDNGSVFVRGIVTSGSAEKQDQCELGKLLEYSCSNGEISSKIIDCFCASTPELNGVCIEENTCMDSENNNIQPPVLFQDPFLYGAFREKMRAGIQYLLPLRR